MKLLDTLYEQAQTAGILYLVAGGHAVNAYTAGRQTGDVDLVVAAEEREKWKDLILALRYSVHFEHPSFMQFRPPEIGLWPLALILVDRSTFQKMTTEAHQADFGGRLCQSTVSPGHLIAMKCHAAKQPDRDDPLKDIRDILQLCRYMEIDPLSDEFALICRKYGSESLLAKIKNVI